MELGIVRERHHMLAEVASLYYESGLNQAEIASRLGLSRTSISRLLSEARDLGVVQISIRWPDDSSGDLGTRLKRAFGLRDAYIVRAGARGHTQLAATLGSVAAQQLERRLEDNMIFGISWNTGVYQVVQAFRAARKLGVTVVQLTGSAGTINPLVDGPDLSAWLAHMLGGQYYNIPAPLVVNDPATREALLHDHTIAEALALAHSADIALVGIGSVLPPLNRLLQSGYLTAAALDAIKEVGAAGELLTTFYDINGAILPLEFHKRTIGLPLADLPSVGYVMGVGAGREQVPAILGALRGGYLDCLVTDDIAAKEILTRR
ncbi:MAG: sugar-binding transcriptional regulator [Anaerolineae bacterium]